MSPSPVFAGQGRVDTHHHILLPDQDSASLSPKGVSFWLPKSLDDHLEFMDKNGIQTAVLSPIIFETAELSAEEIVDNCATSLDLQEAAVRRNPLRFGSFAMIPLPHVQETVTYIEKARSRIIDGYCVATSHGNRYLGDPTFDPVMEKLNGLDATLFVHPIETIAPPNLNIPNFLLEFPTDTARAILNLVLNGVFMRFPRIKFLFSHNGGTFPYIAGRCAPLKGLIAARNKGKTLHDLFASANIYFDTAISFRCQWAAVKDLGLPSTHIIHATDFPFTLVEDSHKLGRTSIVEAGSFTAEEIQNIERGNALRDLFPRLRKEHEKVF